METLTKRRIGVGREKVKKWVNTFALGFEKEKRVISRKLYFSLSMGQFENSVLDNY